MNDIAGEDSLTLDKRTMEVLVAHIIPTSKYFEVRFDHMQSQIDDIKSDIKEFRGDVDKRFDSVKADMDKRFDDAKADMDNRFEQVDKRFEQVDRRFEQVDQRLEQIIASIDRLGDKLDYRDDRQRNFTIRMFTIAIGISILGALGAFLKSIGVI